MIITQTPFRMSFFGGGTDFPDFYNVHGGAVLSTSIDKYCYVTVRHLPRFFEYKSLITYSKFEYVNEYDDIEHPLIREAMRSLDMHELRVTYDADLPARTGLGTSSSFAVGLLNAFFSLKGKYADKKMLADEAIRLERELCKEAGGVQDQIAASFGGLNIIKFSSNGYTVEPVIIKPERKMELNSNLLLFFTGFSRFSSDIQEGTQKALSKKTKDLLEMKDLVFEAEKILTNRHTPLSEFGRALDYTWKLKRGLNSSVSTNAIDELYKKAKDAGAVGGKLLGAGGGGFLLFYVEPDNHVSVRNALKDLQLIPFKFENSGSRITYYMPEEYSTGK